MEPIDSSDSEAIGWHLIARGGDMTARVHPGMQLGVLPSGDLSFEAPDAVVRLGLAGEALILDLVDDGFEFELEAGERIETLRVGAQTHVCLDFLGHTLDIDNDFAVASPPGDALSLYVVRKGELRQALGPLSAPAHGDEILLPERSSVTPLKAVPVDYLRREHAAASAEKRQAAAARSNVRKALFALAASVLLVAALVITALYVASRSVEQAVVADSVEPGAESTSAVAGDGADEPAAVVSNETPSLQPQDQARDATSKAVLPAGAGVGQDVLDRLSALLQAEPLPDKATIDFAVESLRSLMAAYPDDPRIPAALASLNERLVQEARQSYDDGDAFRAGRLIEQATILGLADAAVAETLEYFASQPPGTAAAKQPAVSAQTESSTQPLVTEAEAEAMLIEALAQEEAQGAAQGAVPSAAQEEAQGAAQQISAQESAEVTAGTAGTESRTAGPEVDAAADVAEVSNVDQAPTGLDSLVESATGLALGALAVEIVVEDLGPGESQAETDPVLAALGPALPLTAETDGVESRVVRALDDYLEESFTAAESSTPANELPDGFGVDETAGSRSDVAPEQLLSTTDFESLPSGPRYQPYTELTPVRQTPLSYPSRALEGAEGSIDVEFTVTETGRVRDVNVSGDAPGIFLREAVRTIRTWRFVPVQVNGESVPVRTALRVTYRS